jgi:hypothetical protein
MKRIVPFFAAALLATGCFGGANRPARPIAVGSETVLDRSAPTMPGWAREPAFHSDRDSLYFVGMCAGQPSLARGRDCAFADAMVALARSLGTVYRVDGGTRLATDEDSVDDRVNGIPMVVLSRGAEIAAVYWERKEVITEMDWIDRTPEAVATRYDVRLQVRYPRGDWLRFRRETAEDLRDLMKSR